MTVLLPLMLFLAATPSQGEHVTEMNEPKASAPAVAPLGEAIGDTQVARWSGGRQAAFMLFFDDGMDTHLDNVIPALRKRGLVGTFYLVPQAKWYQARRSEWEGDVARSGMEFADHTVTHSGAASLEEADAELSGCAEYVLRTNPPSKTSPLLSYASPGGLKPGRWEVTPEQLEELKAKHHLVSRPSSAEHFGGIHLKSAADMTAIVDKALKDGSAEFVAFHGVGGEWLSAPTEQFIALADRLAAEKDAGRIWSAGHIAVHKYQTERDSAKVELREAGAAGIRLDLTCSADAELYDQPLTLLTRVPASWPACRVRQGDTTAVAAVSGGVACYDVLPNRGEITIEPCAASSRPASVPASSPASGPAHHNE